MLEVTIRRGSEIWAEVHYRSTCQAKSISFTSTTGCIDPSQSILCKFALEIDLQQILFNFIKYSGEMLYLLMCDSVLKTVSEYIEVIKHQSN